MSQTGLVMSTKRWHRAVAGAIVLLLIGAAVFKIFVGKSQLALNMAENSLRTQKTYMESSINRLKDMDDVAPTPEQVKNSLALMAEWGNQVPVKAEDDVTTRLRDLAEESRARAVSVIDRGDEENITLYYGEGRHATNRIPLVKRTVDVKLETSYVNLTAFLAEAENLGFYLEAPELRVTPDEFRPADLKADVRFAVYRLEDGLAEGLGPM